MEFLFLGHTIEAPKARTHGTATGTQRDKDNKNNY